MHRSTRAIWSIGSVLLGLAVPAVLPAMAGAAEDAAISQTVSAHVVNAGETVTITAVVKEQGTEAMQGVGVSFFGLAGPEKIATNRYSNPTTTKGSCVVETFTTFQVVNCAIGHLNPGESVTVTAVVTMEETMNHYAVVGSEFAEAEFSDAENRNNVAIEKLSASRPPKLTGSPKVKLPRLPTGCVSEDFTLRIAPAVSGVKKIAVALFLGYDAEGEGITWERTVRNRPRFKGVVPVAKIYSFEHRLGGTYKIHIAVRKKGGIRLVRTVEFQIC